jgi:hypothetical protein
MMDQPYSSSEDNGCPNVRSWTRFPPDKAEAWVIVADQRKSATIVDESFGGIGMTMEMADAVNIQVGKELIVLHCDYPTPGRVQWIQRNQETQRIRLGIRWLS